tara:strand:+ start:802 stop:1554 length:753 start_codon:yes stop_codon:yes gene_type:complete
MPYQLSSHPVWVLLEQKQLPIEIIAKIFSYDTVMISPIDMTSNEFSRIRKFFEGPRLRVPFMCLVNTFIQMCFDCDEPAIQDFVIDYIYQHHCQFYNVNDPEEIFQRFLIKIHMVFIDDFWFSNGANLNENRRHLEESLFYLLKCSYYDKVWFSYVPSIIKNDIDNNHYNLVHFSDFDNWKTKYNYKILSDILCNKKNIQRSVTKGNLIGYCRLFGIKHYKSWSKKKLYHSLMTNEATEFNEKYLGECCI